MNLPSGNNYRDLPFDHSLQEAFLTYRKRLKTLLIVGSINIGLFLGYCLLSKVFSGSIGIPAILPIFAIVAIFVFFSAHAVTHPPRRRRYDDSRSRYGYDSRKRGGVKNRYDSRDRGGVKNRRDGEPNKDYVSHANKGLEKDNERH